ncbi:DUF465 domain-containing protein [Desulfobaculum bizertense]|uniref:DUF465 domain-containing protein n=1 Tax=Desulfobaculum bizertense DSM 18034 TaxID=1121442 RepID=A0A1T4WV86_9BACT|nr:DUF465 domain-containing protein [Desulfobaculum bizertense]UIJ38622.1 DUF465 domain-containing protein [Desulfobaculum bizertense]SKA81226.1 hypothetical protein SAMN02745702_02687 [Desulfobaculum bizertense DSM 18034]
MENKDLEMIAEYADLNPEIKILWEEHQLYEKQLHKLERKAYLTPDEDRVVKELKKKKLAGKTKLMGLLERQAPM